MDLVHCSGDAAVADRVVKRHGARQTGMADEGRYGSERIENPRQAEQMNANAGAHGEEYAVPNLQFGQERRRKQLPFEEGISETAEFGSGGYDSAIGAKRGHGFPGRQFSVAVTQAERTAVCPASNLLCHATPSLGASPK